MVHAYILNTEETEVGSRRLLSLRLLGLPREYQASQGSFVFYTLIWGSSGLWYQHIRILGQVYPWVGVPEGQTSSHPFQHVVKWELLTLPTAFWYWLCPEKIEFIKWPLLFYFPSKTWYHLLNKWFTWLSEFGFAWNRCVLKQFHFLK